MNCERSAALDFETQSSYSVRVRGTDQDGLSIEQVFAITVTNVNEAPTALALSNTSVAENSPAGTVVGDVERYGCGRREYAHLRPRGGRGGHR